MTERRRRASDADLEVALTDLARELDVPPAPSLSAAVRARLLAGPPRRASWWPPARPAWRVALVSLAVLLVAAVVLGASRGARSAVAEWLGLGGVSIEFAPASPVPAVSSAGVRGVLGERVTLEEARARVPFPVRVPTLTELGAPDEVYTGDAPGGGQVTLVYRPRPSLPPTAEPDAGMLLTQFRGSVEPAYIDKGIVIRKSAGPATTVELLTVDGGRAVWIAGAPHAVVFRDASGAVREESARLAGNTLLWEHDGITYRLESALDRDAAVRIAESLR